MKSVERSAGIPTAPGCVHVALAEDPARADGDLGLNDVVAGTQWIVFGFRNMSTRWRWYS